MIQQIAKVHQNRLICLNKEIREALGITSDSLVQLTCSDGVAQLEVVEVKTIVKRKKRKKVDHNAEK